MNNKMIEMIKRNASVNLVQVGLSIVSAFWGASLIIKLDFVGWFKLVLFFVICLNYAWTSHFWAGGWISRTVAAKLWLVGHLAWFGLFAYSIFPDLYLNSAIGFIKIFATCVYGLLYFFIVDSFFKQERV